ncbi:biotin/lipoyl-binding protein [Lewinella sp. W8]|nr:biotin/lipoyl-binding protein [Lewinella sp. W8]
MKSDHGKVAVDRSTIDHLDLIPLGNDEYHLVSDGKSFRVKLLSIDLSAGTVSLLVNDRTYTFEVADEYDQLIDQLGLDVVADQKLSSIQSPMPGLILDILVKPGDTVAKGDQLVILEAMKMENILKADGEGVVKSIEVEQGAAVEKGQVLIEME